MLNDLNIRNIKDNKPAIFYLDNADHRRQLKEILDNELISVVKENIKIQIEELKEINRLSNIKNKDNKITENLEEIGVWVYYPWLHTLVHILDKNNFRKVRLSRNNILINSKEQEKYNNVKVGIAGMNVGYYVALGLALEGGSNSMKFADFDSLSLTNLNRFLGSVVNIGENKCFLTAKRIYEIDPFYEMSIFNKGLNSKNLLDFLTKPKIDILVEETDNLKLKIEIRKLAKQHQIPVVMVTGNGPNVILDVERYDTDRNLKILNDFPKRGVLESINNSNNVSDVKSKMNMALDFMNSKKISSRLLESFSLIGRSLTGIPQLGETSLLRGAILTYVIRSIAIKDEVKSGRYHIEIDKIIN